MDIKEIFQVGEHINIEYGGDSYKTIIQDVLPDMRFLVSEPTIKSIPVRIPERSIVNMVYVKPDCSYRFQAEMNGLYTVNKLRMLRFLVRTQLIRTQRRSHYRLPIDLAINVNVTEKVESDEDGELKFTTQTVDISEGGLSFVCETPYLEGTKLLVEPLIPKFDSFEIDSEVVRCSYPNEPKMPYVISVRFYDCPEFIKRSIGKFIMYEQIRRRRLS